MTDGRCYEDFQVGAVYRHWPGKTVTEYDHHLFCLLTMHHHPAHLDAHYAQTTIRAGRNLVVATYLYSLLLGMSMPDLTVHAITHREESLRHFAPVFHGDTVYGESTVLDTRNVPGRSDRGVVRVETRGLKQDGSLFLLLVRSLTVRTRAGARDFAGRFDQAGAAEG